MSVHDGSGVGSERNQTQIRKGNSHQFRQLLKALGLIQVPRRKQGRQGASKGNTSNGHRYQGQSEYPGQVR